MNILNFINANRVTIVASIISASLTGCISMAAGLYTLSKSFDLAQKRDYSIQLKSDIYLLHKTSAELNNILDLVLKSNENIKVLVEFQEYYPQGIISSTNQNNSINQIELYMKTYIVKTHKRPAINFDFYIWPTNGPPITEINTDLVYELNYQYKKFSQINRDIKEIWENIFKEPISIHKYQRIKDLETTVNNNISEMKVNILKIIDSIRFELTRLQNIQKKIWLN